VSKTFGTFTPRNHAEYADQYWRHGKREAKMTHSEHEEIIVAPTTWRVHDPEFEIHLAACFLAATGTLGGPGSRLGATRDEALRVVRRLLTKAHMKEIEELIEDYDLSAPHPPYPFGSGWTEADDQLLTARSIASDERDGILTEKQWEAERHRHWYYRLIDSLPSNHRVAYNLAARLRWRWMRHTTPRS
jgi:hypothetical protein